VIEGLFDTNGLVVDYKRKNTIPDRMETRRATAGQGTV